MLRTRLVLAAVVLFGVLGAVVPASAGGNAVEKAGNCSGASSSKLKMRSRDNKIEVEFEVDQNVNGAKWKVVLKHDGDRFFSGTKTTKAPSGSFSVERKVNDSPGADKISARARNLSGGEVCTAKGSL